MPEEPVESIAASPKPAVVVIQDDGRDRVHSCHAGEMMATTMKRVGAVGLVTDGGLRDIAEIRQLGEFHYFGAGLVVAHGNSLLGTQAGRKPGNRRRRTSGGGGRRSAPVRPQQTLGYNVGRRSEGFFVFLLIGRRRLLDR